MGDVFLLEARGASVAEANRDAASRHTRSHVSDLPFPKGRSWRANGLGIPRRQVADARGQAMGGGPGGDSAGAWGAGSGRQTDTAAGGGQSSQCGATDAGGV